jgi:hypothetical protein
VHNRPPAIPLAHGFIYLSAVPIGRFRESFCRAAYAAGEAVQKTHDEIPVSFVATAENRMAPETPPVSAKKRELLSGLEFFERAYNLLGSTVALMGTEEGETLSAALRESIAALSKLIGF